MELLSVLITYGLTTHNRLFDNNNSFISSVLNTFVQRYNIELEFDVKNVGFEMCYEYFENVNQSKKKKQQWIIQSICRNIKQSNMSINIMGNSACLNTIGSLLTVFITLTLIGYFYLIVISSIVFTYILNILQNQCKKNYRHK